MANEEHVQVLAQGVVAWNNWRKQHQRTRPNLRGADLSEAYLPEANLRKANLRGANLSEANLEGANLSEADLNGADLSGADLIGANLRGADLEVTNLWEANLWEANLYKADLWEANLEKADLIETNFLEATLYGANLRGADLIGANLRGADLEGVYLETADLRHADLEGANLRKANLEEANLSNTNFNKANLEGANLSRTTLISTNLCNTNLVGCSIYGISAWDIHLGGAIQRDLVITPRGQPSITVDNLEVAQFIYLLLHNPKIRDVIDTIAKKAVLILGRFTSKRKPVLEVLRTALRAKGYLPILFDFEGPSSQDLTETVSTLAHLSCFVIADLTDPSCSPYEVGTIASNHVKPIQPLFQPSPEESHEFAMLRDLRQRYYWVLPTYQYSTLEELLLSLSEKVIAPAEQKVDEIATRRKTE